MISRTHILLTLFALLALRLSIGYHFFREGVDKLQQGDFTCEYFVRAARGPIAPYARQFLDDADGRIRLCYQQEESTGADPAAGQWSIDPAVTFAVWDDFVDQAGQHYRFGNSQLEQELVRRRSEMADQIRSARERKDASVDTAELESRRAEDEKQILRLRRQQKDASQILDRHKKELQDFLTANNESITVYFRGLERLGGFQRDGQNRSQAATQVESLRQQIDGIRNQLDRDLRPWLAQVESIWDSLETQINDLAVDRQQTAGWMALHRPYRQNGSPQQTIDRIVPWFTLVVGGLLLVGLFTRLASLAGMIFLAGIISFQPPWVPGTVETYYQAVELSGLFVLFATCAGRFGGLDYFLHQLFRRKTSAEEQAQI